MNKHLHAALTAVLAILTIALSVGLFITYSTRYEAGSNDGYASGSKTGYSKGVKEGEKKQILSLKGDRHKEAVPDLVGQNASQVGNTDSDNDFYLTIVNGIIRVPLKFKTPNGEAITQENAKNYKVTSQEPEANTVFDITYLKDGNGQEYENLVETMGIQNITLTVEKIKQDN